MSLVVHEGGELVNELVGGPETKRGKADGQVLSFWRTRERTMRRMKDTIQTLHGRLIVVFCTVLHVSGNAQARKRWGVDLQCCDAKDACQ